MNRILPCFLLAFFCCALKLSAQAPIITSFTPKSGAPGETVTINGKNFDNAPAGNVVYFGATKGTVTAATTTSLTVIVPKGAKYSVISITANKLNAKSNLPFVVTYNGGKPFFFGADPFKRKITLPVKTGLYLPFGVQNADIDGDGKTDLIVGGTETLFFRNTGNPQSPFDGFPNYQTNAGAEHVFIDFDGDGKLDYITPGGSVNINTSVVGKISFAPPVRFSTGSNVAGMAVADFNGDGKYDVATVDATDNMIYVLLNTTMPDGATTFAAKKAFAIGKNGNGIAAGDIDGDGKPDLLASNYKDGTISILRNTTTQNNEADFAAKIDYPAGRQASGVAVADLDGDGKLDVVATNFWDISPDGPGYTYRNISTPGNIALQERVAFSSFRASSQPAFGDMDGDGKPDMIVADNNGDGDVTIKRNYSSDGTAIFGGGRYLGAYNFPKAADIGDYNGDGKPDITILNGTADILLNNVNPLSPVIDNFSPAVAGKDSTVTITGINFTGATEVKFGTKPAASFTVVSPTTIQAIPADSTSLYNYSDWVYVTTPNGIASKNDFVFIFKPEISTATIVRSGDKSVVTINGNRFKYASAVSFDGVPALSFTIVSDTQIKAEIAASSFNEMTVKTVGGFVTKPYIPAPAITSVSPKTATKGVPITITGTNLTGTYRVVFGNLNATSVTVNSPTSVTAVMGGGFTGSMVLYTPGGSATNTGVTYTGPKYPTITGTYQVDTKVLRISGHNLTTATAVTVGGVPIKSYSAYNGTSLDVVLGSKSSGDIVVTTPEGTDTYTGYKYDDTPVFSSLSTLTGWKDLSVTISGYNLTGVTGVKFDESDAKNVIVVNDSTITATVGDGGTGYPSVIRDKKRIYLLKTFTYIEPPVLTSFAPEAAGIGKELIIIGNNFSNLKGVYLGNVRAKNVTIISPTVITATVDAGATNGDVRIETVAGVATLPNFNVLPAATIASFTPTKAKYGDLVTINGTNFTDVIAVSVGGTAALSYTVVSPTLITAKVGRALNGNVAVVTKAGVTSSGAFTFDATPVLTSVAPSAGNTGTTVTISGASFRNVTAVKFGSISAASFKLVNDSTLTAVLGSGETGQIALTNPSGTGSGLNFTFGTSSLTIASFAPTKAKATETLTINGTGFSLWKEVKVGGAVVEVISRTDTQLKVKINSSVISGDVSVSTAGGTATLGGFVFDPSPVLTEVFPLGGKTGDLITISGGSLRGITSVKFGGAEAITYSMQGDTAIVAIVGTGATGAIFVTANGTEVSGLRFVYTAPTASSPSISSFSPSAASPGDVVTIKGTNFTERSTVVIGGKPATTVTFVDATTLTAVVPVGATSGYITYTNANGTAVLTGFVNGQLPKISYANPTIAAVNGKPITPLKITNTGGAVPAQVFGRTTTFVGTGRAGSANGTGTSASFNNPTDIAIDKDGILYVADAGNHKIRKILPDGTVSHIAGTGEAGYLDNSGFFAQFKTPSVITADKAGNLFVVDQGNHRIRKIDKNNNVTTFAGIGATGTYDGPVATAGFNNPEGLVMDASGVLYVSDTKNSKIRKVTTAGQVVTVSGVTPFAVGSHNDGAGNVAMFQNPKGITIDASGNVYVADNSAIRKVAPDGYTSTYAGQPYRQSATVDGKPGEAYLQGAQSVTTDGHGNFFFTQFNHIVRMVTASGEIITIAGEPAASGLTNGVGAAAKFNTPLGMATDSNGNLFVADSKNNVIRKVVTTGYRVTPALPEGLSIDSTGTISGMPVNSIIGTNTYTVVAFNQYGSASTTFTLKIDAKTELTSFWPYTTNKNGVVYVRGRNLTNVKAVTFGNQAAKTYAVNADATLISVTMQEGLRSGDLAVITDRDTVKLGGFTFNTTPVISYNAPQKLTAGVAITPITVTKSGGAFKEGMYGKMTVIAGSGFYGNVDGAAADATFANPLGAVADKDGNIYVVDANNNKIRKIAKDGTVSTLTGAAGVGYADGTLADARFSYPSAITIDQTGNLFVTDAGNNRVRKIAVDGIVSTVGGNSFSYPYGIATHWDNSILVSDTYAGNVKKILPNGTVTYLTLTGANPGYIYNQPYGIAAGANNSDVYVATRLDNSMAYIWPSGSGRTVEFNTGGVGVAVDALQYLYRSDTLTNAILRWKPGQTKEQVGIFAGNYSNNNKNAVYNGYTHGIDTTAKLGTRTSLSYDGNGSLIVTDPENSQIKRLSLTGYYLDKPLPKGLVFDYATGAISGTPTEVLPATTYTISAYNATDVGSATVTFAIEKGKQEITWAAAPTKTYGDADFAPGATSNNAGTLITYASSDETVVKQVGDKLHIVGAGTATVTASQPKSDAFDAAVPVVKTITVNKAELTVSAFDLVRAYNSANPAFYIDYKGFVNNEDENALTTKPALTTTATLASPAGDYPITPAGGVSKNYSFKYVGGKLTVFPVPVITTAGSFSFQAGGSITLNATPATGGYTYQWYKNAVKIDNSNAATLKVTEPGSYGVSINASNYTTFATPVDVSTVFTLPANNFKVAISATTCKGNKDGKVNITANQVLNYEASLTINNISTNYKFKDKLEIAGLEPGMYSVCISVEGQTYVQCYAVTITEPKDIAAYIAVNKALNTLNLNMENGSVYNIQLNGKTYSTSNSAISLPLNPGNNRLAIRTDKPCQGVVEKVVNVSDQVAPYPNPFQNTLFVNLGENYRGNAKVRISNAVSGQLALQQSFTNCSGVLTLDVASLHNGLYVMHLSLDNNTEMVYKILKK